ncbi:unnamed protein product [Onchocerca ochengi]|uniref:ATP-dependent DNA helicase n=1 Tax=Onchocerca ochengi TaxID=42157 RepID=A0A182EHD2_ONCOC|nr:unnamed protein product [Onchocerca ochengi]
MLEIRKGRRASMSRIKSSSAEIRVQQIRLRVRMRMNQSSASSVDVELRREQNYNTGNLLSIAATLPSSGRTAHSALKLPSNSLKFPHATLPKHPAWESIKKCKLIIWDE